MGWHEKCQMFKQPIWTENFFIPIWKMFGDIKNRLKIVIHLRNNVSILKIFIYLNFCEIFCPTWFAIPSDMFVEILNFRWAQLQNHSHARFKPRELFGRFPFIEYQWKMGGETNWGRKYLEIFDPISSQFSIPSDMTFEKL